MKNKKGSPGFVVGQTVSNPPTNDMTPKGQGQKETNFMSKSPLKKISKLAKNQKKYLS